MSEMSRNEVNASRVLTGLQDMLGLLVLAPMTVDDVDQVVSIEQRVYPHPWTRGNFLDSLYSGYQARTLRDATQRLLGYFLVMAAVDEGHLLNISVDADMQGKGCGRLLLEQAVVVAREQHMKMILLEVRISNQRALQVYARFGFTEIGRRKNYYPTHENTREDAIVMSFPL